MCRLSWNPWPSTTWPLRACPGMQWDCLFLFTNGFRKRYLHGDRGRMILNMGVQNFMPKGHFLYGAGVCAPRGKITSRCKPNRLNYCAEFIVHTDLHMSKGAAQYNLTGRRFQTHDLNFETPLKSPFSIIRQKLEISFSVSIVKPTRCISFSNLFYFVVALYMFRTVFPPIIRSLRLYIQHQVYVKQILLTAC